MSTIQETETAIRKLPRHELSAFRDWFTEFAAAYLAGDQAWPWRTPGVATIRKAFLRSPDRPMKD